MSKYTTGEVAKMCNVTVRTVQYYDGRGILVPSELTDGGRRLYSEDDVKKMKAICFLRDLGMSIDHISKILKEENHKEVISLLVEQQILETQEELDEKDEQLKTLLNLKKELDTIENFSINNLGDIAFIMKNKDKLKKVHTNLILMAIPMMILEVAAVLLCVKFAIWWPILIFFILDIPFAVFVSKYYFNSVAYVCPHCGEKFKPSFKEAFWAAHTTKTRKLRCPKCNEKSYCVEVFGGEEK